MQFAAAVRRLVSDMSADVDAVIVEGKHDKTALERAGFSNTIYTCADTDSLVSLARTVSREDRVTILTDFDAEGKNLNGRLRALIPERVTTPIWRRKMGKLLTRRGRRDIESMNNILDSH